MWIDILFERWRKEGWIIKNLVEKQCRFSFCKLKVNTQTHIANVLIAHLIPWLSNYIVTELSFKYTIQQKYLLLKSFTLRLNSISMT